MAKGPRKGKMKASPKAKTLVAGGTLGTLHWGDKVCNTKAWQDIMKTNPQGKRLYDFGQDLIRRA